MRDFADVSMNLQPKFLARAWPSVRVLAMKGENRRRTRHTLC
jgi:hypothetical protein